MFNSLDSDSAYLPSFDDFAQDAERDFAQKRAQHNATGLNAVFWADRDEESRALLAKRPELNYMTSDRAKADPDGQNLLAGAYWADEVYGGSLQGAIDATYGEFNEEEANKWRQQYAEKCKTKADAQRFLGSMRRDLAEKQWKEHEARVAAVNASLAKMDRFVSGDDFSEEEDGLTQADVDNARTALSPQTMKNAEDVRAFMKTYVKPLSELEDATAIQDGVQELEDEMFELIGQDSERAQLAYGAMMAWAEGIKESGKVGVGDEFVMSIDQKLHNWGSQRTRAMFSTTAAVGPAGSINVQALQSSASSIQDAGADGRERAAARGILSSAIKKARELGSNTGFWEGAARTAMQMAGDSALYLVPGVGQYAGAADLFVSGVTERFDEMQAGGLTSDAAMGQSLIETTAGIVAEALPWSRVGGSGVTAWFRRVAGGKLASGTAGALTRFWARHTQKSTLRAIVTEGVVSFIDEAVLEPIASGLITYGAEQTFDALGWAHAESRDFVECFDELKSIFTDPHQAAGLMMFTAALTGASGYAIHRHVKALQKSRAIWEASGLTPEQVEQVMASKNPWEEGAKLVKENWETDSKNTRERIIKRCEKAERDGEVLVLTGKGALDTALLNDELTPAYLAVWEEYEKKGMLPHVEALKDGKFRFTQKDKYGPGKHLDVTLDAAAADAFLQSEFDALDALITEDMQKRLRTAQPYDLRERMAHAVSEIAGTAALREAEESGKAKGINIEDITQGLPERIQQRVKRDGVITLDHAREITEWAIGQIDGLVDTGVSREDALRTRTVNDGRARTLGEWSTFASAFAHREALANLQPGEGAISISRTRNNEAVQFDGRQVLGQNITRIPGRATHYGTVEDVTESVSDMLVQNRAAVLLDGKKDATPQDRADAEEQAWRELAEVVNRARKAILKADPKAEIEEIAISENGAVDRMGVTEALSSMALSKFLTSAVVPQWMQSLTRALKGNLATANAIDKVRAAYASVLEKNPKAITELDKMLDSIGVHVQDIFRDAHIEAVDIQAWKAARDIVLTKAEGPTGSGGMAVTDAVQAATDEEDAIKKAERQVDVTAPPQEEWAEKSREATQEAQEKLDEMVQGSNAPTAMQGVFVNDKCYYNEAGGFWCGMIDKNQLRDGTEQVKVGTKGKHGVIAGRELTGSFQQNVGAIYVWKRENGELQVISGRHRFAKLMEDEQAQYCNCYVFEEDAQHDERWARMLDYENNMRDDQADEVTAATYVRETGLSDTELKEKGLMRNASRSKRGAFIGRHAREELWTRFINGKVKPMDAEIICNLTRSIRDSQRVEEIQRRCCMLLDDGKSWDYIGGMVQLMANKENVVMRQSLLDFGADFEADMARAAEWIEKNLAKVKEAITLLKQGRKLSGKKRADAERLGITTATQEGTEEMLQDLEMLKSQFELIGSYPDLVAQAQMWDGKTDVDPVGQYLERARQERAQAAAEKEMSAEEYLAEQNRKAAAEATGLLGFSMDKKLDDFFEVKAGQDGVIDVPVGNLLMLKKENPQSVVNAWGFMREAAQGKRSRRGAVSVADNGDGTYTIVDGNATSLALAAHGASHVRVKVVGNNTGSRLNNSAYLVEEGTPGADADGILHTHGLDGLTGDSAVDKAFEQAVENLPLLEKLVKAAADKVGGEMMMRPANDENGKATKKPSTAKDKAKRDYQGDISCVVDLIGGTCVMPSDGDFYDAVKAIRKLLDTPEFKGSSVAKVKKLGFKVMTPQYRDIKVSVRFPNGGIGEIILVEAALNDAKFNRGGHLLYDVTRELEPYRHTNKKAHDAYHALAKLSKLVYQTDEPVDSASFARAKSVASKALEGLGEESQNLSLSSSVATMVKSSDSLLKKVTPASVVSAATPSSSLIQNISKDMISNVDRNVNDKISMSMDEGEGSITFSVIGPKAKTWDKYDDARKFTGRDDGLQRVEIDASQAKVNTESLMGKAEKVYVRLISGWDELPEDERFAVLDYADLIRQYRDARSAWRKTDTDSARARMKAAEKEMEAARFDAFTAINAWFAARGIDSLINKLDEPIVEQLAESFLHHSVDSLVLRDLARFYQGDVVKLEGVLDFPELYEAYPQLRSVAVSVIPLEGSVQGQANRWDNSIDLDTSILSDADTMRSVLLHEIQHIIQGIEGFAKGGNTRNVRDKVESVLENTGYRMDAIARDLQWLSGVEIARDYLIEARKLRRRKNAWKYSGLMYMHRSWGESAEETREKMIQDIARRYNAFREQDNMETEYRNMPEAKLPRVYFSDVNSIEEGLKSLENAPSRKLANRGEAAKKNRKLEELVRRSEVTRKVLEQFKYEPYELYVRLAGEIEARNVQLRRDWTAEQRAARPFNETLEYPGEALVTYSVIGPHAKTWGKYEASRKFKGRDDGKMRVEIDASQAKLKGFPKVYPVYDVMRKLVDAGVYDSEEHKVYSSLEFIEDMLEAESGEKKLNETDLKEDVDSSPDLAAEIEPGLKAAGLTWESDIRSVRGACFTALSKWKKELEAALERMNIEKPTGEAWHALVEQKPGLATMNAGKRMVSAWSGKWLDDVLDFPELYEAYPELRNIELAEDFGLGLAVASYSEFAKRLDASVGRNDGQYPLGFINMNPSSSDWNNERKAISTLLHEVQHAIQDIEGFARGGNPKSVVNQLEEIARKNDIDIKVLGYDMAFFTAPDYARDYLRSARSMLKNPKSAVKRSGLAAALRRLTDSPKETAERCVQELQRLYNELVIADKRELRRKVSEQNRWKYALPVVDFTRLESIEAALQDMKKLESRRGYAPGKAPKLAREISQLVRSHGQLTSALKNYRYEPYELYRRLAGEIESRNVESRLGWSAEQRAARPFNSTLEYPGEALVSYAMERASMKALDILASRADERAGERLIKDWQAACEVWAQFGAKDGGRLGNGAKHLGELQALIGATKGVLPEKYCRMGHLNGLMRWAGVYAKMQQEGNVPPDGLIKGHIYQRFVDGLKKKDELNRLQGMSEQEAKDALALIAGERLDVAILKVANECRRRLELFLKDREKERIDLIVERAYPKREEGKKSPRGKMSSANYERMEAAYKLMAEEPDKLAEHILSLRQQLEELNESDDRFEEKEAKLEDKIFLAHTFGAWDNMSYEQARRAAGAMAEMVMTGRNAWQAALRAERRRSAYERSRMSKNFKVKLQDVQKVRVKKDAKEKSRKATIAQKIAMGSMSYSQLMLALQPVLGKEFSGRHMRMIAAAHEQLQTGNQQLHRWMFNTLAAITGLQSEGEIEEWLNSNGEIIDTKIDLTLSVNETVRVTPAEAEAWAAMKPEARKRERKRLAEEAEKRGEKADNIPNDEAIEELEEKLKASKEKGTTPKEYVVTNRINYTSRLHASKESLLFAILTFEQDDYKRLLDVNGLTEADLQKMRELVGDKLLRWGYAMRDKLAEQGVTMAEVYEAYTGVPFGSRTNYFRGVFDIQRSKDTGEAPDQAAAGITGGKCGPLIPRRYHNQRLNWGTSASQVFVSTYKEQLNYIATAHITREWKTLLSNQHFEKSLRAEIGDAAIDMIAGWCKMIDGAVMADAKVNALMNRFLGKVLGAYAVSRLAGNVYTLIKQVSALLNGFSGGYVPERVIAEDGLVRELTYRHVGFGEYLISLSRAMSGQTAISVEEIEQAGFIAGRVREKGEHLESAIMLASGQKVPGKIGRAGRAFSEGNMDLIGVIDRKTNTRAALALADAVYRKAVAENADGLVPDAELRRVAIETAGMMIDRAAQPVLRTQKGYLAAGGGALGALGNFFYMFKSEALAKIGLWVAQMFAGHHGSWITGALAYGTFNAVILALVDWIRNGWHDDDEDKWAKRGKEFAFNVLANDISAVPFIGDAVADVRSVVLNEYRWSSSQVRMAIPIYDVFVEGKREWKNIQKDASWDKHVTALCGLARAIGASGGWVQNGSNVAVGSAAELALAAAAISNTVRFAKDIIKKLED